MLTAKNSLTTVHVLWAAVIVATAVFVGYKLHDLFEPFAFGHVRWSDAYTYWFARAHLDLNLTTTLGLNVEGVTDSGEPIFYLSAPPFGGLTQAAAVSLLGGEFWTVRILPLLLNLITGGLIGVLAYRLGGVLAAPLAILLFFGIPFELKYGTSNEGYQVYAIAAGLVGYLVYMRFLASGQWSQFIGSLGCFALGMCFNWLAGFMAAAMLAHLWLQTLSTRIKWKATLLAGAVLVCVVLGLLIQQGMATGEFLYPLRRALERSKISQDEVVTLSSLFQLQLSRYWDYFGPVVAVLNLYWFLRRIIPKPNWGAPDIWAALIWSPGIVYGFLLRGAAYSHDFLLLGFLPGATVMACLGLLNMIDDLRRVTDDTPSGRWLAGVAAVLLLTVHTAGAIRSAQNFERQEADDLAQGAARTALYLQGVPADDILAADQFVTIGRRGRYVSIQPFIDYLVRRPVRAIDDINALRDLMCEAEREDKSLILLQWRVENVAPNQVLVPRDWIEKKIIFDRVVVLHLITFSSKKCNSTANHLRQDSMVRANIPSLSSG